MDILVSEHGLPYKCTCRNRVFCCGWIITKKTDMALFDAKFLADIPLTYHTIVKWRCLLTYWPLLRSKKQNIHNWINVTFRNQIHNSSSNRQHRVSSPSVNGLSSAHFISCHFHSIGAGLSVAPSWLNQSMVKWTTLTKDNVTHTNITCGTSSGINRMSW